MKADSAPSPWRLAITLAAAMAAGPSVLHAASAAGPLLLADLNLARSDLGTMAALCFGVSCIGSQLSGRVAERRSLRLLTLTVFVTAALALATMAMAPVLAVMFVALLFSGVSQALIVPVGNKLLMLHTSGRQRGLLMGIKQSGIQIGQVVSALAVATGAAFGWRWSVGFLALLVVVLAVLAPLAVPRPAVADRSDVPADALGSLPREVYLLAAVMFTSGAALQSTNVYLPLFTYERFSFAAGSSAAVLAIAGLLGFGSRLIWGTRSARTRRPGTLLALMFVAAAAGACSLLAASVFPSLLSLWLGVLLHGAVGMAIGVVVNVVLLGRIPESVVARSSGTLSVGLFAGFAVGPPLVGQLVDTTGSYTPAWMVVIGCFLTSALLCSRLSNR